MADPHQGLRRLVSGSRAGRLDLRVGVQSEPQPITGDDSVSGSMRKLLWLWMFLATFFLVSCDHESTVKVFVTGPDASVSTPAPVVNVPPITVNVEVPTTNLMGPP